MRSRCLAKKIVASVDRADDLQAFLRDLGRDHRKFGVLADHYGAVGASLLATFAHFSGDAWTPELEADWTGAYETIASVMIAGIPNSAMIGITT